MDIITIKEAAKLSNQSQKTIRREIASGNMKSTKIQNKTYIQKSDFDEWKKKEICNIKREGGVSK